MIERVAKRFIFRLVPTRAKTKDEAPTTDLVECIGHLRQHRRGTERGTDNKRAECDMCGNGRQSAEHSERLPGRAFCLIGETVDEMVRQPDRVETHLFSDLRYFSKIVEGRRSPIQRTLYGV